MQNKNKNQLVYNTEKAENILPVYLTGKGIKINSQEGRESCYPSFKCIKSEILQEKDSELWFLPCFFFSTPRFGCQEKETELGKRF